MHQLMLDYYLFRLWYRAKKLFGRDISLYMNLHRAKKMFGRDIFLYMNLYRAKKVDEQFLANKQTKRTEVGTLQILI